jgi:predicted small lipoprotein YifL
MPTARPFPAAAPVLAACLACLVLAGCGQRGPLYLPTDPAAAQRASLPQTLDPTAPAKAAPTTPAPTAKP